MHNQDFGSLGNSIEDSSTSHKTEVEETSSTEMKQRTLLYALLSILLFTPFMLHDGQTSVFVYLKE